MDEDVERFFEECRADGLCRDKPETFDYLMEILEKVYRQGDESAAFQEFWDDIREIVALIETGKCNGTSTIALRTIGKWERSRGH
jgi:hypothetical protein